MEISRFQPTAIDDLPWQDVYFELCIRFARWRVVVSVVMRDGEVVVQVRLNLWRLEGITGWMTRVINKCTSLK